MRTLRYALLLTALVVGGVGLRSLRLYTVGQYRDAQRYEDVYYLPRAHLLPLLSVGYQAALADLLWCRSLVYFGEELGHSGTVQYLFQYTDAILALDSSFKAPYRWVATAALYRPTEISIADGLHAASYLKRAVSRWPNDGELRWDYGSLLRFELAPMEKDAAKKRVLFEQAAPQLAAAASMGAGPPWLALNNADLLNKLGRTEQAIRHLEDLRDTVQDPAVQTDIDTRLNELRTRSYVEAIGTAEEQFERERLQTYPYLTPGLFLWVGASLGSYHHFIANGFSAEREPE